MRTSPALAVALWVAFGFAVFSVVFDWHTRMAGFAFVEDQQARRAEGRPLVTIEDGFRPLVGEAARRAAGWMALVTAAGVTGVALTARRTGSR